MYGYDFDKEQAYFDRIKILRKELPEFATIDFYEPFLREQEKKSRYLKFIDEFPPIHKVTYYEFGDNTIRLWYLYPINEELIIAAEKAGFDTHRYKRQADLPDNAVERMCAMLTDYYHEIARLIDEGVI